MLGGANSTGVSTFELDREIRLGANRAITLVAAGSGTNRGITEFKNSWVDSSGGSNVANSFTIGATGYSGIVQLGNALATSGAVNVVSGRFDVLEDGGSLSAGSGILVNGPTAELKYNAASALASTITLTQGILSGTGAIDAAVSTGGLAAVISPGNSPGIMPFGTSQTWNSFTYLWETNNFTGTTAGTDFDQITINGSLSLTGTGAGAYLLDITSLTALDAIGLVPNYDDQARSWTILTTTGGITGFDAANWTLSTAKFSSDPAWQTNGSFSLATANNGNDLVLNFIAVPEPGSIAIAGIGIATAAWLFRRRRR
jgi:hypothetical protein